MIWMDISADSYVEEAGNKDRLAHKDDITDADHDCQDILFFQDVIHGEESGYRR